MIVYLFFSMINWYIDNIAATQAKKVPLNDILFAKENPINANNIPLIFIEFDLDMINIPYKKIKLKNRNTASIDTIL